MALFVTVAAFAPIQPRVERVRDGCANCAIEIRLAFVTHDPDGALADEPYSVFTTPSAALVVGARAPLQNHVVVFDSTGRVVRIIGRTGPGPGELAVPTWTAPLSGDTIRVFMPGRAADFTVHGGFVREVPQLGGITFVNGLRLFRSGTHVTVPASAPRGDRGDGSPLVVRAPDGSVVRRIAELGTGSDPVLRVLGRARAHDSEQFWVAQSGGINPKGYSLMLASTGGTVHRTLMHEPSGWHWYAPGARGEVTGPSWRVVGVHERADGRLLVMWSQPVNGARGASTVARETRLVAIDLRTLAVTGVGTIPARAAFFVSDSTVLTSAINADGEPELTVFELRLR